MVEVNTRLRKSYFTPAVYPRTIELVHVDTLSGNDYPNVQVLLPLDQLLLFQRDSGIRGSQDFLQCPMPDV